MNHRLTLHLGAHKTATSLIQQFMVDRSELMARNSIRFVARAETSRYIGWGYVGPGGRSPERELAPLRVLIKEAFDTGARYFVLSHENSLGRPFDEMGRPGLYPRRDEALGRLLPIFEQFPKKVVYYVRSQDEFLESYYLQTIHEGSVVPFQEWLSRLDMSRISWHPVVESLRSAFGQDKVEVKDFATEMAHGQQEFLRRALIGFCGNLPKASIGDFNYTAPTNISIGDRGLDIALAINQFATTPRERALIRKFLQDNFSNRAYPRPKLLTREQRAEIRNRYYPENIELSHLRICEP